jgi:selenocysteine lyase/cysteine desulfurase
MPDADAERLRQFRELLPATGAGIYLDTATRGPLPAETAAAMREAEDWELRVGRVWDGRDEDVEQRHEEARAVVAALVGADPDDLTLAPTLETAAHLVSRFLGTAPGEASQLVDPRVGAGPRTGQLTAVVDASMAAGAVPLQVAEIGADAVIFAADRWLLGPEGVAAIWTRPGVATLPGLALPRTALIGLARSIGWLEMYVGLEWIYERTTELARRVYEALANVPGVEMLTPAEPLAAIVTFRLSGWQADEALLELSRRVQALARPLPELNALRASVGWFNTEEELDRFANAVAELAAHTPDTLPRRPSLIVLGD